jgi:hypothetical protein
MVFFPRDSLLSDFSKTSKQATTLEQTSIEDRRRKLEERLNCFHQKAEEFLGENADEDLDVLPPFTGWENENKENEQEFSDAWEEDEDEISENPEMTPICLPSSLKPADIQRLGLGVLATQELELRKGQANDCLQNLRMALGHKAVLYRTKVRKAKTSVDKTRIWDDVKAITVKINKHIRAYRRARKALQRLGADNAILLQYQELQSEHLKLSADITEENRFGQRSDVLPWFWRLGGQNEDQHDTWMEECKFIVFYESNC